MQTGHAIFLGAIFITLGLVFKGQGWESDPTPTKVEAKPYLTKEQVQFPTLTHYGVAVTRTNVDGVDCILAYNAYNAEGVALECQWPQ